MRQVGEPVGWREIHAAQRDKGIRKRTFTVIGPHPVGEKTTGETAELEFTEEVIDLLIAGGFIQEQGATTPVQEDEPNTEDVAEKSPAKPRATRARQTKEG